MEDDCVETRLEDLEKLKTELILDCCSSNLWKEFKRSSKLSKELLTTFRDLFISNHNYKCHEELQKKLHCTRFFCGLSESRIQSDDDSVVFLPIHPTCVNHAQEICKMYPFALTEQQHFMNIVKVQVVLSAYRAGKTDKAFKLFADLYDEKEDHDEEYQEQLREFFHSLNQKLQTRISERFSYEKFLRQVVDFLKPVFSKYDVPFLEKVEECFDSVDEHRIPCSFLQIYHDHMVTDGEDTEASWDSIIRGTHPDIKEFKSSLRRKQKSKHSDKYHSLSEDDNVNEEFEKTTKVISKLKKSSKQLQDFIRERNEERNDQSGQKTSNGSPFNKNKWNQHQEDAAVIEWTDSEEELDNRPTIRLRTPKRLNVSPLKSSKRRKKNPWSEQELDWLCKGVEAHGEGQWSVILRMFPFSSSRTSVDLKDKWRNYSKNF